MKTLRVLLCAAACGLLAGLFSPAQADRTTLSPTRAVLLPAAGAAEPQLALAFDLSGLRSGEGRRIDEALLEWNAAGLPADLSTVLAVTAITAAWTEAGVTDGAAVRAAGSIAAAWRIDEAGQAWSEGRVRFDITELARDWASDPGANHGILISLGALDRATAARQIERPRLLVRYGFMK